MSYDTAVWNIFEKVEHIIFTKMDKFPSVICIGFANTDNGCFVDIEIEIGSSTESILNTLKEKISEDLTCIKFYERERPILVEKSEK